MNNVIIGQKGSGKTYRLFEQADAVGGIIVGENPKNLRIIARTKGFDKIKDFIDYETYINLMGMTGDYYFIDNIEDFVKKVFYDVQGFTVSI
jgi:hypothetical protein